MRRATLAVLCLCAALLAPQPADAGDASAVRRLAAEVVVMLGDLRRLTETDTPDSHRVGLRDRILGGLSPLGLLVREARLERATQGRPLPLDGMRRAIENGDFVYLRARLVELALEFPLDVAAIVGAAPTAARLARGRYVYEALCAGCHTDPDEDRALPAFDLFRQSASSPAEEFAARLISGLRGTPATALDNPFSTADLAALMAYFRSGPGGG